jgi:hypothetical protein
LLELILLEGVASESFFGPRDENRERRSCEEDVKLDLDSSCGSWLLAEVGECGCLEESDSRRLRRPEPPGSSSDDILRATLIYFGA